MAKDPNKNNSQQTPVEFDGEQIVHEVLGKSFDDLAHENAGVGAKQPAINAEHKKINARFKQAKGTLDRVVAAARAANDRDNAAAGTKYNCDSMADVEEWLPGTTFAAEIGGELINDDRDPTADERMFFDAMEARASAIDAAGEGIQVHLYEFDNNQAEFDSARIGAVKFLEAQKKASLDAAKASGNTVEQARRQAEYDAIVDYGKAFANPANPSNDEPYAANDFIEQAKSATPTNLNALRDEMIKQEKRDRAFASCDEQVRETMHAQLEARRSAERADVDDAVAAAQDALAKELAKRQGRTFRNKNGGESFEDAQDEYNDAVRARIALAIRTQERAGENLSEQEKILIIANGTAQASNELQPAIAEHAKDVNPRRAKFYNFMAGLKEDGTPETSKSKKWMRRIVKTSIVAGIAATTGGLATGVGIGVVAGFNSYASKEAAARAEWLGDTGGKVNVEDLAKQLQAEAQSLSGAGKSVEDGLLDKGVDTLRGNYEKDTTSKQNRRAKRMGVAALKGAAIGGAVAVAPVLVHEAAEQIGETAQHAWDSFYQHVHGVPNPSSPYTGVESFSPTMPNIDAISNIHVDYNGGLFETFKDMGIQGNYTEIMNQAGPELVAHGDAYVMSNGDYGWVRPGYLSQEALNIIQRARGY